MSEELKHEGCGCGCDSCASDCAPSNEGEQLITLTMDDGQELTCSVVTIFPAAGKEYIALLPLDEDGENEEGEVFIYRFLEDEEGNPQLDNILDDEEYEVVADAFDEFLDSMEYDEETEGCDCGDGCDCEE